MKIKFTLFAILLLNLNCYASEISENARKQLLELDESLENIAPSKLAKHIMVTSPKPTYKITIMFYNKEFEGCKLASINLDIPKSTTIAQLKTLIAQQQNCFDRDVEIYTADRHVHKFPLKDTETLEEIQSIDRSSIWAFNTKGQFPK